MFELGDSVSDSAGTDVVVAGMLSVLTRDTRAENVGRARIIETICEIFELRMADAEDRYRDPLEAYREVLCEVASTLRVSLDVARSMIQVAERLHVMPLTAVRFVCGMLNWSKVVVLTSVLAKASARTIAAIEFQVVAAAERYNPRSLRKKIWHYWMVFDHEEASAAQEESTRLDADVRVDPKDNGMALLSALMTDLQGAEAEALIAEIAGTVCKGDPRSGRQLRVDGLMALLHGEHALECGCDTGEDCPVAGNADGIAPRRGHLLQILVDVQTVLGLSASPAVLPDGTALDPEVVRVLAEDSRWQAILTEQIAFLDSRSAGGLDSTPTEPVPAPAPLVSPVPSVPSAPSAPPASSAPPAPSVPPAPLVRVINRGRVGRSAVLPDVSSCLADRGVEQVGDEAAMNRYVSELISQITADPTMPGVFPDGHGGLTVPSQSALVYKPSALTADLVRTAYRSCAFPECEVPSTKCELDHIVPFDHRDPAAGGWTIASNLQPLCTCHHQAKTARMWGAAVHAHGAIAWISRSGIIRVTVPDFALPTAVTPRRRSKPGSEVDPNDPTWWETNMPDGRQPPTLAEERAAESEAARSRIRRIRRRFREHKAVLRLRERNRPAPF